jgi:hypothetical protein
LAGRALGRADEVRGPEPGWRAPLPLAKLPRSRDFRWGFERPPHQHG